MANVLNGNTFKVDSTGAATGAAGGKNVLVTSVTVTPSGGNASLILSDNQGTPVVKMQLDVPSTYPSQHFDYSTEPLLFPNGVYISTATNVVATVQFKINGAG